jgi:hypothetical protein
MKKKALVNIKGGLGNQLFIVLFANYLKKNGFKVYYDIGYYDGDDPYGRNFELNLKNLKLDLISPVYKKIFQSFGKNFGEVDDLLNLNTIYFNHFTGYYQDLNFFDKEYLLKLLEIKDSYNRNSVMIHMRRNDYITLDEELQENYYIECLNKLKSKHTDCKVFVFTDDINYKKSSLGSHKISKVYNPSNESPLTTLKKMMSHEHFIIANSSLSLIAASAGAKKNSMVFYPEPWMRNSIVKIKNIDPSWNVVKNIKNYSL